MERYYYGGYPILLTYLYKFNTDKDRGFTCIELTDILTKNNIKISMDGGNR